MNFNKGEYYLYKFSMHDCIDDNFVWFDEGYTLAHCEKVTQDRVSFMILAWQFGKLDWISTSFYIHSTEGYKYSEMNVDNKITLFETVFAGNYLGNGGSQFGFIFNQKEDD